MTAYKVHDPHVRGRTITDIDSVDQGVLWEVKSASDANDTERWIAKNVRGKFERYLEARQYLPGYEAAPIGFRYTGGMHTGFQEAIEQEISTLRSIHPNVTILTDWR